MLIAFLFAPTSHLNYRFPGWFLAMAYEGYKSLFYGEYVVGIRIVVLYRFRKEGYAGFYRVIHHILYMA